MERVKGKNIKEEEKGLERGTGHMKQRPGHECIQTFTTLTRRKMYEDDLQGIH